MEIANYMHMKLGEGRATAAISFVMEGDVEVAYVGMSFCSPYDQFSRKIGRLIAAGRLNKDKYAYRLQLDPDKQVSVQLREAVAQSIEDKDILFPTWSIS